MVWFRELLRTRFAMTGQPQIRIHDDQLMVWYPGASPVGRSLGMLWKEYSASLQS